LTLYLGLVGFYVQIPPALLIFAVSETFLLKDSLIKVGAVDTRKSNSYNYCTNYGTSY
jgi:hypothetical protein